MRTRAIKNSSTSDIKGSRPDTSLASFGPALRQIGAWPFYVVKYTFDDGNLIRTQFFPQGATTPSWETDSVFDALGRAIWSTGKYIPGSTENGLPDTGITTHTIYNSLGEAIETESYENTQINFLVTVYRQLRAARDFVGAFLCRDMAAPFRSYFSPLISR